MSNYHFLSCVHLARRSSSEKSPTRRKLHHTSSRFLLLYAFSTAYSEKVQLREAVWYVNGYECTFSCGIEVTIILWQQDKSWIILQQQDGKEFPIATFFYHHGLNQQQAFCFHCQINHHTSSQPALGGARYNFSFSLRTRATNILNIHGLAQGKPCRGTGTGTRHTGLGKRSRAKETRYIAKRSGHDFSILDFGINTCTYGIPQTVFIVQ